MQRAVTEAHISDIKVGRRHRRDLGDVAGLAASIERIGLLHPVVVRPDMRLVVGERRLAAFKHLGRETVPIAIADNFGDLRQLLWAEADENTCRLDFSPEEAAEVIEALLPECKKMAAEAAQEGKSKGGKVAGKGRPKTDSSPESFGKAKDHSGEALSLAGAAVGVSGKTAAKLLDLKASGDTELMAEANRTRKVERAHRKLRHKRAIVEQQKAADKIAQQTDKTWTLSQKRKLVECDALVTDPPYGILDQLWEPDDLEEFTREWASYWCLCRADFIAAFWSQRYLWDGRRWFDESLVGYQFQQLLIWHCPNNKSPQSRKGFKQTWEPIFFYRRADSDKEVRIADSTWGEAFTDFDCHVAAVPQENFNGENMKQHPAQKPVSVMLWLVNALTQVGDLVCDPFCGSGTTGIAAVQLGRRFHGIDSDNESVELARRRIAAYGVRGSADK